MSAATLDLLFWIVVFAAILFGFRWLQRRRKKGDDE